MPHRLERLRGLYPAPGFCDEELIFFRASDLRTPPPDSPHKPDEDEDITTRTVTVAEARAMVARGEIVDLKTAYALTLIYDASDRNLFHTMVDFKRTLHALIL